MKNHNASRRKFAKKLVYIAPAILTLKAQPSFAAAGSGGGSLADRLRERVQERREARRSFFSRFF
jgi:hypothetical protein